MCLGTFEELVVAPSRQGVAGGNEGGAEGSSTSISMRSASSPERGVRGAASFLHEVTASLEKVAEDADGIDNSSSSDWLLGTRLSTEREGEAGDESRVFLRGVVGTSFGPE